MITLITGTPGAGKTLYAVTRLIKEINENPERQIYADITGLRIDGVHLSPDDWRDAPDGALIIYDECQYRDMFKRGRGANAYTAVLDLTTHRHTGKDIWLITQTPSYLHKDVLAVVGEHYHLDRPMGAKLANLYRYRQAEEKPGGTTVKARAESRTLFKYDKKVFDYYDSVDVADENANHKKLKIPLWKVLPLIVGLLILIYTFYNIAFDGGIKPNYAKEETEETTEEARETQTALPGATTTATTTQTTKATDTTQPQDTNSRRLYLYEQNLPPDYAIRRTDPYLQVRGVAMMGSRCQAYNAMGDMMLLTDDECKSYVGTGRVYKTDYSVSSAPAQATQTTTQAKAEPAETPKETPQETPPPDEPQKDENPPTV